MLFVMVKACLRSNKILFLRIVKEYFLLIIGFKQNEKHLHLEGVAIKSFKYVLWEDFRFPSLDMRERLCKQPHGFTDKVTWFGMREWSRK